MGFISGEHSPRSSWFPVASDALDNPSVVSVEISTISTAEAGQIRKRVQELTAGWVVRAAGAERR